MYLISRPCTSIGQFQVLLIPVYRSSQGDFLSFLFPLARRRLTSIISYPCPLELTSGSLGRATMDKSDLARATSKNESNVEGAPKNDTTNVGTRPTFLGRTHQCVLASGSYSCHSDLCLGSSRVLLYLSTHRHRKGVSTMPITSRK